MAEYDSDFGNEPVLDDDEESNAMDEEQIQSIITSSISDAVDYIDEVVSPVRAESAAYYNGEPLGNEQEGRSSAQTMDVRDSVQSMLPSLLRIFCGTDHVVEYAPRGAEDIPVAKQATEYVNFIIKNDQSQPWVQIVYALLKDALVKGTGWIKWGWDSGESVTTHKLRNLDDQALAALNADENVEISMLESVSSSEGPVDMQNQPLTFHTVEVTHRKKNGRARIEAVPPEEIVIDRFARSIEEADLIAHRRFMTVSELVEMGYDLDTVEEYVSNEESFDLMNQESRDRLLSDNTSSKDFGDPAQRHVLYVEAYAKLDVDGDGVAELRKLCCMGEDYAIQRNDPVDQAPFAMFSPDPEPHCVWGLSIADLTKDIQRIKSAVLRSSLDSLAMSTHPRVGVVEGQASLEDVMNVETGGIIRMRNPGAVVPFALPYVGRDAFPMMQYLDEIKENRTGISKAADGLDPSALQSSTLMAVQQTVAAAQQRIEMIARLFAEGGMTQLYKGLLRLIVEHQDQDRVVRLRNEFVPMNPAVWDVDMDVVTNISMGKGGDQERLQMLLQIASKQEQIIQQAGPDNPLAGLVEYRNTLVSAMELAGFKDPNRFFKDPAQQPPKPQEPPKPDINEQLIQVQMAEIQANIQKKSAELALERESMMREDDRLRDKNEADIILKSAEIAARWGAQVDLAEIKANSERDREMVKQLAAQAQQTQRPPNGQ